MNDKPILVWDLPVRVFHWLLVASFAGAWLTAESERWRLLHVTLGYTMALLLVFRLLWGFVGTRHARFADFVRGPRAALAYLGSVLRGRPAHHAGHNPAGALAIVGLLLLGALGVASGWATYNEFGGDAMEEVHEAVTGLMLALVGVHVAGVLLGSLVERHNLVRSMWNGRKPGPAGQGIGGARRGVAALLLAAVVGLWFVQWQDAPSGALTAAASTKHEHDHDDD